MRFLAACILVLLCALPASAHTAAELEEWRQAWTERAVTTGLTPALVAELVDMTARHAPRPVEANVVAARAPSQGMGSGVEQWRGLVAAYFPASEVDTALRIMACESGGDPDAYNPSGASGLMQVLSSWADNFGYQPADLFDPEINVLVASKLYADGGWGHWVCY